MFCRLAAPVLLFWPLTAGTPDVLPDTKPLDWQGDLSAQMVASVDQYLSDRIAASLAGRAKFFEPDLSSAEAYTASLAPNRERLAKMIGAVEPRREIRGLEYLARTDQPAMLAKTNAYAVSLVRWPAFEQVTGEGLLVEPAKEPIAQVIVIPDADQSPEELVGLEGDGSIAPIASRLAEQGFRVVVPVLTDRADTWSGNPSIGRLTNQPHREWIYRQAYQMGRHVIGYEVEKVRALVDWFAGQESETGSKIGLFGYGEGGLIALYTAALDPRIEATVVSGYFGPRERVWAEPIYRNVFGLLKEFGDAELARLIAPRGLYVEYSPVPNVTGPPAPRPGRTGAAPGALDTPKPDAVRAEIARAITGVQPLNWQIASTLSGPTPRSEPVVPGSDEAIRWLVHALRPEHEFAPAGPLPEPALIRDAYTKKRQQRQVEELVEHTQKLLRLSEHVRREFWSKAKPTSPGDWDQACEWYRDYLWDEVIGRLPAPSEPANPRTRKILAKPRWTGYEVVLDVWPGVFAWGYLLVPNDLKPGERRPLVVCQHGLEGLPEDTVTDDPNSRGFGPYKAFAARLAERGFITYAPHNPYRGGDNFRGLVRKANPLGVSLYSVLLAQHEQLLNWLGSLDFVDAERIGFYGLSYGGKTAMRVPALLKRYALAICSADFNDWIRKNVTVDDRYSYLFTGEYEMFEFDLGHTFNYAELAGLIAPRPFMVERGHHDGVAPDEWVAYEFAKVRRLYDELGIGDRTQIEFFPGPHTINGVGTFRFLHRHLDWPGPSE